MSDTSDLPAQYLGNVVPNSFSAGFICLSYVISLIGAMSTLELVSRRTSQKGLYNHALVLGAAISMGGISIWSMHYIGNRAIYIHRGEYELQIVYSVKMTIISLFLPILVLLLAFLAVSSNDRVHWWRIGLSGCLSGGAICGMHYLGNLSIQNYRCEYSVGTIVGAALIAVVASTAALALFFVLQAAWTISWWRKILCAMLLAAAVSGMHWCAAVGTKYRLLQFYTGTGEMSRATTIVVVICLSIAASVILVASAIYSARTRMLYATKAQQIALAAAVFDARGRILVNQGGFLPSQVITDTILQKAGNQAWSNNDIFGVRHPLFHWMFRVSRNWPSVATFLDGMAIHVAQHPGLHRNNGGHTFMAGQDSGQLVENYDVILREQFCLAASALASKTNETLTGAGVLWDEIFPTGTSTSANTQSRSRRVDQAEKGIRRLHEYSKGLLMFLVRRIDNERSVQHLETAGYRFVEMHQAVGIIASSMQIQCPEFGKKLESMAAYKENEPTLHPPGVHLGMFAIRARLDYGGFDVLVGKDFRNILPAVQLPLHRLEQWQIDLISRFDGLKMSTVTRRLNSKVDCSEAERQFRSELRSAVGELRAWLKDPVFEDAVLVSKVIQVPCAPVSGTSRSLASLISFKLVLDIHDNARRAGFDFVPLQLFKVQQLVLEGSPERVAFAHNVHREMSSFLSSVAPPTPTAAKVRHSRIVSALRNFSRSAAGNGGQSSGIDARKDMFATSQERLSATTSHTHGGSFSHGDLSSIDGDPKSPSFDRDVPLENMTKTGKQQQYGGIMVSQQITVNVQGTPGRPDSMAGENSSDTDQSPSRKTENGPGTAVHLYSGSGNRALNVEAERSNEKSTFVDELMELCMGNSNGRK